MKELGQSAAEGSKAKAIADDVVHAATDWQRDGTLADKLIGYIRRFVDRVKKAYEGITADSAEGKTVAGWAKEEIEDLQDRFADALYDASETFKKTDVSRLETSDRIRFQLRHDPNSGKDYVQIPITDIIGDGIVSSDSIGRKARLYLNQKFKGTVKIKRIARGDCFYDITEIENITNDNIGQSIINNAAKSIHDVSNSSISQSDPFVNS